MQEVHAISPWIALVETSKEAWAADGYGNLVANKEGDQTVIEHVWQALDNDFGASDPAGEDSQLVEVLVHEGPGGISHMAVTV